MLRRARLLLVLALSFGSLSCTSSIGLDLAIRGVLHMTIARSSSSAMVTASAFVTDSGSLLGLQFIDLQANQVFSVNATPLVKFIGSTYIATVGAVDAPAQYTVAFDNAGAPAEMMVTPPADFTAAGPANGTQVTRAAGFDATWSPSGDPDVLVDIEVRGLGADGDDDDGDPDLTTVSFTALADSGTHHVAGASLASIFNGNVTLRITRYRTFPQSIGLSAGDVRVEIFIEKTLTLAD